MHYLIKTDTGMMIYLCLKNFKKKIQQKKQIPFKLSLKKPILLFALKYNAKQFFFTIDFFYFFAHKYRCKNTWIFVREDFKFFF